MTKTELPLLLTSHQIGTWDAKLLATVPVRSWVDLTCNICFGCSSITLHYMFISLYLPLQSSEKTLSLFQRIPFTLGHRQANEQSLIWSLFSTVMFRMLDECYCTVLYYTTVWGKLFNMVFCVHVNVSLLVAMQSLHFTSI